MSELNIGGEADLDGAAFRSGVERVVQSTGQEFGETSLEIAGTTISVGHYSPDKPGTRGQGARWLGDLSHMVEIHRPIRSYKPEPRLAVYGVSGDTFTRLMIHDDDPIAPIATIRAVESEEVAAVMELIGAPFLHVDNIDILMALTAEEQKDVAEESDRLAQLAKEQRAAAEVAEQERLQRRRERMQRLRAEDPAKYRHLLRITPLK